MNSGSLVQMKDQLLPQCNCVQARAFTLGVNFVHKVCDSQAEKHCAEDIYIQQGS